MKFILKKKKIMVKDGNNFICIVLWEILFVIFYEYNFFLFFGIVVKL